MIWFLCTRYVGRWRRQKRLYFSIVFSVTLRGLSCAVMPWGRRGCGKEQCDRWLQGTVQQHCSALSAACMGLLWEVVFWELPAAGDPGGVSLPCCNELEGVAPASVSICPKSLRGPFCRGHPLRPLQDGPSGIARWPETSLGMAIESKWAVSRAKCSPPFSNILCCCLQCCLKTWATPRPLPCLFLWRI